MFGSVIFVFLCGPSWIKNHNLVRVEYKDEYSPPHQNQLPGNNPAHCRGGAPVKVSPFGSHEVSVHPENRVVILTGATQGIGRAAAGALAQAGCRLALAARSAGALQALVEELGRAGAEAIACPTDMGDTAQA